MKMSSVHFIGIGGTGLSAIARVLLESGVTVTGSDRQDSPLARSLREAGVTVFIGHASENIRGATLVIRSSAVPDDNPEAAAARAANIPVLKRSDFMGQLMAGRIGIAVAGTHGKTTTTAMISWMLTSLGLDPTFIVGGTLTNLGVNARSGKGPHFVIEADEYDRMFLGLRPKIAIVTNVEHDHPDCYPTSEDFYAAFLAFTGTLTPEGVLVACGDNPGSARLLAEVKSNGVRGEAYGLNSLDYAYSAHDLIANARGGFDARLAIRSTAVTLSLQAPGRHNVLNALAALAVADQLGLDISAAAQALNDFTGTGRRFEVRGEQAGVIVIDDYAHHPTEIRATLAAARARYPGRNIWAVWQPHTYSRTRTLQAEFAAAFNDANHVIVTAIYAAREAAPSDGFSARQVVSMMKHNDVHYVPTLVEATMYLLAHLHPGDVLLTLSAGDADQVSAQVIAGLSESQPQAGGH